MGLNYNELRENINLYRQTKDKKVLETIINLHDEYLKKYISAYECSELEKDEILSIIALSIIEIAMYFDIECDEKKYLQNLKRTIKKNIYDELCKVKIDKDKESYEYYCSQHKNGEEESYSSDLCEIYMENKALIAFRKELETFKEREQFILLERYSEPKLSYDKLGEILNISRSRVAELERRTLRLLRHPRKSRKFKYLYDKKADI